MADPSPVEVVNEAGRARLVLVCEHASNWMPDSHGGLGLPAPERQRHIAWDIGAAEVARKLSHLLDAPLVLAGASRLLIDLNRPLGCPTSIPARSEATDIPGNRNLSAAERDARAARWFHPFHDRLAALLDDRRRRNAPTRLIAVHSFTPVFLGEVRPWRAGVLYRRACGFGAALVEALGGEVRGIAHNQPYQIEDQTDFTVPFHGDARGLDAVLVELRQDLIADPTGAALWAGRLARALAALDRSLADPPAFSS